MTVGISLLTLVPGVVGGSETYARELVRALERVGEHEYRVFKPTIADGDLPGQTVRSYRASRSLPGRVAAMAEAAVVPRRIRREIELGELDATHFPLTVMLPRVDHPRRPPSVCSTSSTSSSPSSSRAPSSRTAASCTAGHSAGRAA